MFEYTIELIVYIIAFIAFAGAMYIKLKGGK